MRRTALLIGAQTHGLTGVGNDIDTMAVQLARRGFTTVRCQGRQATRAGILDSYERLVREARTADAVVVYFSGHGGVAVAPPELVPRGPFVAPRLQFIVPTDYDESMDSDFRGVTAVELSVLLARLTGTTPNVTVLLDTCHAAHMSRDADLRVKALYRPAYLDVAEHLRRLGRHGLDTTIRHVLGNPDAVRIVACGADQSAYEYTNSEGLRCGLLTESMASALTEVGDQPVTWATLMQRVRRRVREVVPGQRPEAEGPSLRQLFQAVTAYPSRPVPGSTVGSAGALGARVSVEWGVVTGGRPRPLPLAGAVVHVDDLIYVSIANHGGTTVFVSLLEIDVRSRVSLLTSLDPSGVAVRRGERCLVGGDDLDGRLRGVSLTWPVGVDESGPRPASIVVLVSSAVQDVSLLQSEGGPGPVDGVRRGHLTGGPDVEVFRDLSMDASGPARHDVHTIAFRLDPASRPASRSGSADPPDPPAARPSPGS